MSWAASQSFPLVGTATSIQSALQLGLLDPINAYLNVAANALTSSNMTFAPLLQNLNVQIGDLTATVAPNTVSQTLTNNNTDLVFSLDFVATDTTVAR